MASGHGVDKPDQANHPSRRVAKTRLDTGYSTLGDFTSRTGKVDERAISLNTYRKASLRRSITADPIRRRNGLRQVTGGELEGR